jgi:hypothetical protein
VAVVLAAEALGDFIFSLRGWPPSSSQLLSLNPSVSTTNVVAVPLAQRIAEPRGRLLLGIVAARR